MAQVSVCRPLTAEAQFQTQASPCGICGGPSDTGTGVFTSPSVSPCQYHSPTAPIRSSMVDVT
jgi:hypothetical protein